MTANQYGMDFTGKTVFVTGGSGELGFACAKSVTALGGRVAIFSSRAELGEKAAAELNASGGEAAYFQVNVRDVEEVRNAADRALAHFGGCDALINNVGVHFGRKFAEIEPDYFDTAYQTNVRGHFFMTQRCLPALTEAKGSVVNVASVHALETSAGLTVYAGTKAAIAGMTRSMAIEFAPLFVRVNCVLPGLFPSMRGTEFIRERYGENWEAEYYNPLAGRHAEIPMHRPGTPDEIAAPVVFLASGLSTYMTGSTVVVDGGHTACLR